MGWMVNALIFLVSHTAILWPKRSSSCKIPAAPQFYSFRIVNRKAKGSTPVGRTQSFFSFVLYAAVTSLKKYMYHAVLCFPNHSNSPAVYFTNWSHIC